MKETGLTAEELFMIGDSGKKMGKRHRMQELTV